MDETTQLRNGAMADVRATRVLALQQQAKGTNINEQTLLATDYLNHFNEVVMLIEMLPDMPDCLEDAKDWSPKSYCDHFRSSHIADRELAIEAYEFVPQCYRVPFDEIIGKGSRLITLTIARAEQAIGDNDMTQLRMLVDESCASIYKIIGMAGAIIHGTQAQLDQTEIDSLLERS